jgi:hypothetical protein
MLRIGETYLSMDGDDTSRRTKMKGDVSLQQRSEAQGNVNAEVQ